MVTPSSFMGNTNSGVNYISSFGNAGVLVLQGRWSDIYTVLFIVSSFPKILSNMLIQMFLYYCFIVYDEKIHYQAYTYLLLDLPFVMPF